ncbi:MAG TPA: ABC transporter ATP-binding protein [Spirochaetota bacterium]|nr:ABC transporter ATP-binding protein [Spirochaetota bacterium]
MLKVEGIDVHYGIIPAVRELSLSVEKGQIATLVGANGAGKSTTLKAVMGALIPKRGTVLYKGEDVTGVPADKRVGMGIALVPEGRQIFSRLTVRENLNLGAYHRNDKKGIINDQEWIYGLFPVLKERGSQLAGTLSGGEQQMLALGRGLMSHPQLLMLDEPSLGLAPIVVVDIYKVIEEINRSGITILLVEQNINMAMKISSYAYIMETGKIRTEGKPDEVMKRENIMKVYLGE